MFIVKSKHLLIFFISSFLFLANCQLKTPNYSHGINSLANREAVLEVNKSKKNDVIALLGKPHSIAITNEDKWFYFERVISRGKLLKLGQNVLKTNNVLEVEFNKFGVLENKKMYKKEDMEKVKYSKSETTNEVMNKSAVDKVLSSIKKKMYGRKKKF